MWKGSRCIFFIVCNTVNVAVTGKEENKHPSKSKTIENILRRLEIIKIIKTCPG